jgi:hypothetical protein
MPGNEHFDPTLVTPNLTPCRRATHECEGFCSSNAIKSPLSARGHHRRKRPPRVTAPWWHNPSYRRRSYCPACPSRNTSFAMALTRVLPLLCHLHCGRPMDDICADTAQFQCVLICCVLARMSSLPRDCFPYLFQRLIRITSCIAIG